MTADPSRRFRENVTGITSLLVTALWLGLLLSGVGGTLWLVVLVVGYVAVVPLVAILFGDEEDVREWWDDDEIDSESIEGEADAEEGDARDALETLRERYATGELTDEQFERKLERLLETETLEDVQERASGARGDHQRGSDRDLEYES